MRLHAYVLAADPAFLQQSIRSYYDLVDRIVVSYDRSSTSWTGTPIPVEECLTLIKEVDAEGKCVWSPGDFWRPGQDPLANDTHQRRDALATAARDADWVLQFDTDEILPAPDVFLGCLERADRAGAEALDYPARWLYAKVSPTVRGRARYLEEVGRLWRPRAGYPGPLAVRSGVELTLARQAGGARRYRVDWSPWNTDPHHPDDAIVHEVIDLDDAVRHFSWVRSDEVMRRKFGWSGHTADYSRPVVYERWVERSRHPWRAAATSVLRSWGYRVVTLPDPEAVDE